MRFDYQKPTSLAKAWDYIKSVPHSSFIAGGTDLMVQIKHGAVHVSRLVSLRSIPELNRIKFGNVTSIGACTVISDIAENSIIIEMYPVLAEAASRLGSKQIRNVATIGGNLCNASPCADTALPLLVLEADIKILLEDDERVVQVKDFFTGPGETCLKEHEIVSEILISKPEPNTKALFYKKSRVKMDLSQASLAVLIKMNGNTCEKIRIAAGSVAPVPLRLFDVENILKGTGLEDDVIKKACKKAMESVSPISDVRASDEYRREIISVYLKRALLELKGR